MSSFRFIKKEKNHLSPIFFSYIYIYMNKTFLQRKQDRRRWFEDVNDLADRIHRTNTLVEKKTVFRGRQNMTLEVENKGRWQKNLPLPLQLALTWTAEYAWASPHALFSPRQKHTRRWHHRIFYPNIMVVYIYPMAVYIHDRLYIYICTRKLHIPVCACVCKAISKYKKPLSLQIRKHKKKTTWQKPITLGMCAHMW